jgi:sarcosine oxidase
VAADTEVLYQANTGIVSPAATVPLLQRLATDRGATLRDNTAVAAIEPGDGRVAIRLADGTDVHAAQVVIAADAWTASLVEPLGCHCLDGPREQVVLRNRHARCVRVVASRLDLDGRPVLHGFPRSADQV